ncbi:ABC transporter substrate-binding protein [Microbacterium sp. X-17]|uniref:ABC transporter substrate-binding protein n=1 Tax=Microbacterium sp. X-17 TaxID=3144404 RepID=UPI0031F4F827
MNRSRTMLAGIVAVAMGALSACSSAGPSTSLASDQPVTITFSSYNYGTPGAAGAGTQALLDAFAAEHPNITVQPQSVPTADVLTKAKTDVAAGNAPDVVQIGYSKLAEAFQTLPVRSLQDIAGGEWAAHVDGINPSLVQTGENKGSIAALPYTISVPTLFYNADLFRAAGLDPDAPPTTIDAVRQDAQAIVQAGHQGAYFGIVDSGKSDYLTQSVIDSAGGAVVSDSGDVTVASDAAVRGLTAVQALTTAGLQPAVGVEDAVAAFSSGNLGMLVVSTAVAGSLQKAAKFDLRSSAFPSFGAGTAKPTFSGAGLIVLSDDPVKQAAAWQLVKFLTSAEGNTIVTKQIGYLPLRAGLADDPAYLKDYFAANHLLLPAMKQLADVSPYRFFPGSKANQAVVLLQDNAVEPIVLRGADPRQTLTDVAARIRELTAP